MSFHNPRCFNIFLTKQKFVNERYVSFYKNLRWFFVNILIIQLYIFRIVLYFRNQFKGAVFKILVMVSHQGQDGRSFFKIRTEGQTDVKQDEA